MSSLYKKPRNRGGRTLALDPSDHDPGLGHDHQDVPFHTSKGEGGAASEEPLEGVLEVPGDNPGATEAGLDPVWITDMREKRLEGWR